MAGSPGAGKTELSKSLIEILGQNPQILHPVIRIDGDEIRLYFSEYTGTNSHLFQAAISIIVDKVLDSVMKQKQTFVLDGTLFDYEKAAKNIKRSIDKGRQVMIFYLYQEPEVAWKFTQAREKAEGRRISKSAFIQGFLGARETVSLLHKQFADKVDITLIRRNFEKDIVETVVPLVVEHVDAQIDHYIPKRYTKDELEKLL